MVMSFRVSELQVLLGFAGRNKSGRKHELLAKALHLLKSSCAPSVQMKIKELYRRRFPRKTLGPSDLSLLSLPPGTPSVGSPGPLAPIPPTLLAPGTLLGPKREVDMHPPLPQPVHPDVTMKPLPFYEVYGELIRPTTLGMALCGPCICLASTPPGPSHFHPVGSAAWEGGTSCTAHAWSLGVTALCVLSIQLEPAV